MNTPSQNGWNPSRTSPGGFGSLQHEEPNPETPENFHLIPMSGTGERIEVRQFCGETSPSIWTECLVQRQLRGRPAEVWHHLHRSLSFSPTRDGPPTAQHQCYFRPKETAAPWTRKRAHYKRYKYSSINVTLQVNYQLLWSEMPTGRVDRGAGRVQWDFCKLRQVRSGRNLKKYKFSVCWKIYP